jgi:dUTP pyrophosphatase
MSEIPTYKFAIIAGDSSFLPTRSHPEDTGWDVKSAQAVTLNPGQYFQISLGFRVFAPEGWWLECRPRSSSFSKKHLHSLYGVIDQTYEGICFFSCQYIPDASSFGSPDLVIARGDRIGQLVPVRRQEMKVESVTDEEFEILCKERNASRKAGGFGSTG